MLLLLLGWSGAIVVDTHRVFWAAVQVHVPETPETWLEINYPGCPAAAQWVRDQGLPRIHSLPIGPDPVAQRMSELLYPLEVLPAAWSAMPDGAIVVFSGDDPPVPADELFARGVVRIVRVRR
ncbi:MAG TPA: hypothetical protein VFT55_02635 [Planctomycetota bacterium]|nr:hypothetical protein [Planctomycetota bacterium]